MVVVLRVIISESIGDLELQLSAGPMERNEDDEDDDLKVDKAMSTLLPMLLEIQYFRFNPTDGRCDMKRDEIDLTVSLKLEAVVEDYIQNNSETFKNACERLLTLRSQGHMHSLQTAPAQASTQTLQLFFFSNSGHYRSSRSHGHVLVVYGRAF